MNTNMSAGEAVVISMTTGGAAQKVAPQPGKDPGGVWGKHKAVMIKADSAGATVYFSDPASGVDGLTLGAGESISFDFAGTLWVNSSTGTTTIVAMG